MNILEFVETRIAEDEASAITERDRREIVAKRDMIQLSYEADAIIDGEYGCCHSDDAIRRGECRRLGPDTEALYIIARVYRDHPDYRPEWDYVED